MLNQSDIDVLLEACDALSSKAIGDHMFGSLMSTVLAPTPEAREKASQDNQRELDRLMREQKQKREEITLIKAKLIQIRRAQDSHDAERLLADAGR